MINDGRLLTLGTLGLLAAGAAARGSRSASAHRVRDAVPADQERARTRVNEVLDTQASFTFDPSGVQGLLDKGAFATVEETESLPCRHGTEDFNLLGNHILRDGKSTTFIDRKIEYLLPGAENYLRGLVIRLPDYRLSQDTTAQCKNFIRNIPQEIPTEPLIKRSTSAATRLASSLESMFRRHRMMHWIVGHLSERESMGTELTEALTSVAGIKCLGFGWSRLAFALDENVVIKLAYGPSGRLANGRENLRWKESPSEVKNLLAPVFECDPAGRWLTMARTSSVVSQPVDRDLVLSSRKWLPKTIALLRQQAFSTNDLRTIPFWDLIREHEDESVPKFENIGVLNGKFVIHDYESLPIPLSPQSGSPARFRRPRQKTISRGVRQVKTV